MASASGVPPVIDRASLDRLIALGQERGALGPDDLRAVLPIDAMRVEDVVLVILELEEAGIGVEPDAFGPARAERAAVLPTRPVRTPATGVEPHAAADEASPAAKAAPAAGPTISTPKTVSPGEDALAHRTVAIAGLATFLVLAALLLII